MKWLVLVICACVLVGVVIWRQSNSWDKVFPRDENVIVQKVHFKNRYGIDLTGDLYMPKNKPDAKLPAIAVAGPFGAVKE